MDRMVERLRPRLKRWLRGAFAGGAGREGGGGACKGGSWINAVRPGREGTAKVAQFGCWSVVCVYNGWGWGSQGTCVGRGGVQAVGADSAVATRQNITTQRRRNLHNLLPPPSLHVGKDANDVLFALEGRGRGCKIQGCV